MTYVPGVNPNDDRDFVQCHLLTALFEKDIEEGLALKGGFGMRVQTGSVRQTKDIDLQADHAMPVARVQARVRAAMVKLKGLGVVQDLKVTMPKQTETTLRWKINGLVGKTELHLTVEVSRRDHLVESEAPTLTWTPPEAFGMPPAKVKAYSLKAIAAAKVDCLSNPTREAPRDVYDLHVLIKSQVHPPIELIRNMDVDRLRDGLVNLWTKLEAMTYDRVRTELLPFMPPDVAADLTADAWESMRLEVGEHVEQWMKASLPEGDMCLKGDADAMALT